MKKTPSQIDLHVGAKVRTRRLLAGLSQEKLGKVIGVSFQQVQKYEKGTNRISAGHLQQIAVALNVPLTSLFDDAVSVNVVSSSADEVASFSAEFLSTADGIRFLRAFRQVRDARTRKTIIDLVVTLAATDDTGAVMDEPKSARSAA